MEQWAQNIHAAVGHLFPERATLYQILEGIRTYVHNLGQAVETTYSLMQAADVNFRLLFGKLQDGANLQNTTDFLTQRLALLEGNLTQLENLEISPLAAQISELRESLLSWSQVWEGCQKRLEHLMQKQKDSNQWEAKFAQHDLSLQQFCSSDKDIKLQGRQILETHQQAKTLIQQDMEVRTRLDTIQTISVSPHSVQDTPSEFKRDLKEHVQNNSLLEQKVAQQNRTILSLEQNLAQMQHTAAHSPAA